MSGQISYRDIKTEIVARIRRGDWPVDGLIPGEADIATELGCARATVNRALRELADEGVVERKRKAGTRVVAGQIRPARIEIPLVRNRIEDTGARYTYRLVDRRIAQADARLAEKLHVAKGSDVLAILCLHLADGVPHQLEERWINPTAVPAALDETFEAISPNEWLVREKPLTDAEHVISAVNATSEEARLLAVSVHDALFVVERRTWLGDQTITYVRQIHVGADYQLVSRSAHPDAP